MRALKVCDDSKAHGWGDHRKDRNNMNVSSATQTTVAPQNMSAQRHRVRSEQVMYGHVTETMDN